MPSASTAPEDPPAAVPPSGPAESSSGRRLTARAAGRGGAAVAGAKVYFMLVGLVQQIALKHAVGLAAYGALSTALQAGSIAYNSVVQTSIQGVSRAVAQASDEERPGILRRTLRVHALLAVVLGLAFFALAPGLARFLGAPHIEVALQILSAIIVVYGLYAPLVGALNGMHRFVSQAAFDVLAATLRTVGLVGGGLWLAHRAAGAVDPGRWTGVEGALLGFVGSAALVLAACVGVVGFGKRGGKSPDYRQYLRFVLPILLGQGLLNLLFQADGLLLRLFASQAASHAGLDPQAADPLLGSYRAAQLFCFLPYQLLMSITFVLFPLVARAKAETDVEGVRRYVRSGVRLGAIITGLLVSVVFGLPHALIDLVYGADAAALGGNAARILSIGLGFFALFGIQTAVLNSLGHERASALVTGLAFLLVVTGCVVFVAGQPFGEVLLVRTALATAAGLVVATLIASYAVRRTAGGVIAGRSALRVGIAIAVAAGVGSTLPPAGKLMTLVYAPLVGILYVACLVLTRELGSEDLGHLKAVIKR